MQKHSENILLIFVRENPHTRQSVAMQKIVLFIEASDSDYYVPSKIGNLFINRFAIEEDAFSEILKIFELEHSTSDLVLDEGLGQMIINNIMLYHLSHQ